MVEKNRVFIFIIGLVCSLVLLSRFTSRVVCQSSVPSNISFAAESNSIYLFDRNEK